MLEINSIKLTFRPLRLRFFIRPVDCFPLRKLLRFAVRALFLLFAVASMSRPPAFHRGHASEHRRLAGDCFALGTQIRNETPAEAGAAGGLCACCYVLLHKTRSSFAMPPANRFARAFLCSCFASVVAGPAESNTRCPDLWRSAAFSHRSHIKFEQLQDNIWKFDVTPIS